ncbi:GATA zinc finger domain-containing protein 1 [Cyphomyrmex costatus]|uniref:GATA zinc finger domain-containing protein 1 n=1 Tax=Cyphomyrmex costatus TaxID=456900 RepID=A0A195CZ65_9HYME|nr:GATA zinc finger domain-containing protein 1 [Cyphomyrmex costatus]
MFQTLVDGPRGASSLHQRVRTRHIVILRCRDSRELYGVTLFFRARHSAPADETLFKQDSPGQGTCHNEVKSAKRMSTGRFQDRYYRPVKAPTATATPVTSNFVFYKGTYFQVGDVVSLQDIDGGTYYAQIRGLLTDQYCEKSAAITWLLPTTASPPPEEGFIPETYLIGPEEDLPRKLECMEFVMHAPSDYFKLKNSPYPPSLTEKGAGFIWTTLRNELAISKK